MPLLHLDWETFGRVPFGSSKTSVGLWNYATHEDTEILLAGFAVDHDPVEVLDGFNPRWVRNGMQEHPRAGHGGASFPWTEAHDRLYRCLTDNSYEIVCFNAEFERVIARYVAGITINPSRFICTMARAWSLSFVGGLAEVAKAMGFPPDKQKLARGRRLLQKFAKPRRPSKANPRTRWLPTDDINEWAEFREYCAQDVVVSREVLAWTDRYPWHPVERSMWNLDQEINDRGWPIDTALVANANRVRRDEERRLRGDLETLTGLDNPNSRDQMLGWLAEQEVDFPDLRAETIDGWLDTWATRMRSEWSPVISALKLKQQLGAATPKKLDALQRNTHNGRLRASLEFGAAQRTQRWGGRVVQPHNLYSEREYDTDEIADVLTHADHATVHALYGDVMRVLKGAIRPCIAAPSRRRLIVADFSSIESRLLGWHSGEERINGIFRRGEDTYRDLASRIFRKPVADITKEERTFAKPPELGCGYMLSGNGLVKYAAGMGIDIPENQSKRVVDIWRESNPAVVNMWEWLQAAAMDTVQHNTVHAGYQVRFRRDEHFMFIDLPSGRSIYYYQPQLQPNDWGRWGLTYMGRYQDEGGKWQRVHTHPGKITENIIQAVARDILRDAMLLADKYIEDLDLIGHVHDEPVGEADEAVAEATLRHLVTCMSAPPIWAPGLLLAAEGQVLNRYRKI